MGPRLGGHGSRVRRFSFLIGPVLLFGVAGTANPTQAASTADYAAVSGMILPPGTDNEHALTEVAPYDSLVNGYQNLTPAQLTQYFKDSHFGPIGAVSRTYSPRGGTTVIRDAQWGVPHVYGQTDEDVWFGAGYVSAEDRLSIMDVLRALGRSDLLDLAGSASAYAADVQSARLFGYTEADLQAQLDRLPQNFGPDGARSLTAIHQFIAGINTYVTQVDTGQLPVPAAYQSLGKQPALWTDTDVVAVTAVVAQLFGEAGGGELGNAAFLNYLQSRFGKDEGARVYEDFRNRDNRDGPTQASGNFPYMPRDVAALDPAASIGPFTGSQTGQGGLGPAATAFELGHLQQASSIDWNAFDIKTPMGAIDLRPHGMSNALIIGAQRSATGHPLMLAGPQAAYWSPEILLELDLHGPTINTRGAAFPGISLFTELGRGPDFAWSATSGGSDNIDTRAEKLCEPDGSPPTVRSQHYMFNGKCTAMEVQSLANQQGFPTIEAERTVHGPVIARGSVGSAPVALTRERSTYLKEVDSAPAFLRLNTGRVSSAHDFIDNMSTVNFGANWLYMDDKDIAYVHTGLYPVRPLAVDPDMVSWGTGEWEWQGFLGAAQHPHELNPSTGYLTSWNNKPAPAWSATDGYYGWSALYRAKMLNDQIEPNHAITPVQLVQMMERVGLTDMRGSLDLPFLLRVLDKTGAPGPRESEMESLLKSWLAAGPYRLDNGHGNAVAIMDAWWPALIPAMYNPVMGDVSKVPLGFDNSPGAAGSAYQDGFYGQVWTDLSMLLGGAVKSPTHRVYCGGTATQPGDVQRCSRALWGALRSAGDSLQQQQGSNNPAAWDYSAQAERIRFLPAAAVSMQWVNRPTFQQLEEFSGHRPAGLTSLPAVAALQALPNTSTAPVVVFLLALVLAAALAFRALTRSPRPAG